jgi:large subunit ribosomal protein L2
MALKHFNPVTPSLRGTILIDRTELWKGKPVKGLTEGKHSSGGRNNHGRITSRRLWSDWNMTQTAPRLSR